ncbi:hypothetical protein AYI68_g3430 [Smittium mucronatum]|uniref:Uncharacterized protein n=1 Tax=Smittium mucronatum TaxID=133383 RepID=A0A1R0GZX9_9FUNG|nr:hypothetical protein AYI68_g3430 [Smittium mucronatum]
MEGISPLLRLSTLRSFLPALTKLIGCTTPTVGIIGESLTTGLGLELNESPSNKDTRSSITGFPLKLTDGSKSLPSAENSVETVTEVSLSLSSATSRQASTSGVNPYR